MDTMTERLERLAELQKKNSEPLQQIGGNAFTAFELMARKNYELMGDMVEYAVAQSRGSMEQTSPKDLYERQLSEARAFAERMSARAAEYVTLAERIRTEMHPDSGDGAANPTSSPEKAPAGSTAPTGRDEAAGSTTVAASAADEKASAGKTSTAAATKKKSTTKTSAAKTSAAKKSTAKETAAGKPTAKKRAAKKSATKKPAARKTPASKRSTANR